MDNKMLEEFINATGALVEMWTLVYKNFLNQGLDAATAIVHTREFMQTMLATFK